MYKQIIFQWIGKLRIIGNVLRQQHHHYYGIQFVIIYFKIYVGIIHNPFHTYEYTYLHQHQHQLVYSYFLYADVFLLSTKCKYKHIYRWISFKLAARQEAYDLMTVYFVCTLHFMS